METYNKRVSTYKHGEFEQTSVNLVSAYKHGELEQTSVNLLSAYKHGELEQTSVNLVSAYKHGEVQHTSVSLQIWRSKRVSTYKHGEVQQTSVNLQTTYNVIPLDSCVHTVRLLQPQGLYLSRQLRPHGTPAAAPRPVPVSTVASTRYACCSPKACTCLHRACV